MFVISCPNSQNITCVAEGVTFYGIEFFFHLVAKPWSKHHKPLVIDTTGKIDTGRIPSLVHLVAQKCLSSVIKDAVGDSNSCLADVICVDVNGDCYKNYQNDQSYGQFCDSEPGTSPSYSYPGY